MPITWYGPGIRKLLLDLLVVVWMIVAPLPKLILLIVIQLAVRAIFSVLLRQVAPVGVVFASIPVVMVMMISIVHADLRAAS